MPTTRTCMMESPVVIGFEGLSSHERRASGNFYGDRYSGRGIAGASNWTSANSVSFGDLATRSVTESNLSTNGEGTIAGEDWFSFTLSSSRSITIRVNPTGGSYWYRHQYQGVVPIQVRHAESAGNLAFELTNNSGTVIASTNAGGPGETETLIFPSLPPLPNGEMYKLRVHDVGPNPDCDMVVQLYDLSIRVGESLVPPRAVAGINKRIAIANDCYFMGQFYSRALEPGATIVAYEWDPGEGEIASSLTGEVHYRYTTTGTKTARLRVQDSFGTWSDWDEIKVVVY